MARALVVPRTTLIYALERWQRPEADKSASPPSPLHELPVTDLADVVAAVGMDRAAGVFGVSRKTLSTALRDRGVSTTPPPRQKRLESRLRDLEGEAAHVADLRDRIVEAAGAIGPIPEPRVSVNVTPVPLNESPVDCVLHVSDMQYGERVEPEEVTGGHYSPDVFRDERLPRWEQAAKAMIEGAAAQHPIDTVWVVQGGDFVEGDGVFSGQHWHLAMDAGQQVATLSPLWAQALTRTATIAKELGARQVIVVSVVGNHGVHGGRKAGAVPASLNYDYLTYLMVEQMLPAGVVDRYESGPAKSIYFRPQGWLWLATHGDQDRGGGLVGVPVVTGSRNDLTLRVQTGMHHTVHLVGHFHRPTQVTIGGSDKKIWNGDFCGANNLSTGRGGGSLPTQRGYVVHPKWGLIQTWDLYLTAHGGTGAEVIEPMPAN